MTSGAALFLGTGARWKFLIMTSKDQMCETKTNQNVLSRRLGEEMILFHLETDRFYELNGTAARFWELLNSGHEIGEARRQILEEFDVDPDQLTRETEDVLDLLRRENLIQ